MLDKVVGSLLQVLTSLRGVFELPVSVQLETSQGEVQIPQVVVSLGYRSAVLYLVADIQVPLVAELCTLQVASFAVGNAQIAVGLGLVSLITQLVADG